jgi:hypothetical protein
LNVTCFRSYSLSALQTTLQTFALDHSQADSIRDVTAKLIQSPPALLPRSRKIHAKSLRVSHAATRQVAQVAAQSFFSDQSATSALLSGLHGVHQRSIALVKREACSFPGGFQGATRG